MGSKERLKMKRSERAKQFAPFAALKGFEEAIKAKEKILIDPHILTEEESDELDRVIHRVSFGDMVHVKYREDDDWIELSGVVSRIDIDARVLKVVNTKILFENMHFLEIIKSN